MRMWKETAEIGVREVGSFLATARNRGILKQGRFEKQSMRSHKKRGGGGGGVKRDLSLLDQ